MQCRADAYIFGAQQPGIQELQPYVIQPRLNPRPNPRGGPAKCAWIMHQLQDDTNHSAFLTHSEHRGIRLDSFCAIRGERSSDDDSFSRFESRRQSEPKACRHGARGDSKLANFFKHDVISIKHGVQHSECLVYRHKETLGPASSRHDRLTGPCVQCSMLPAKHFFRGETAANRGLDTVPC